jgi:hypothetical protein
MIVGVVAAKSWRIETRVSHQHRVIITIVERTMSSEDSYAHLFQKIGRQHENFSILPKALHSA